MKKQTFVILLLLLNSLIVFIPIDIVRGDPNPSGGNIVGDTVYWENSYANLSVYPHTSNTSIIRQKQWANLTWKESDNAIDVAFRFNDSLSYGEIWRWTGDTWSEVSMNHLEYGGKHYYYYAGFNVVQDTTYRFKWEYDVIANTSGKWDLFAKLNEHTVQQALDNNWYVALDPWWNSGWARCTHIKIDNTHIDATLTNFPILVNISAELSQHCNDGDSVRFVNLANDTEYAFEFDNNETFDGSTYNLAWVNITSISSSSDTFFNMYFDNVGASDGQDSDGVWDINFTTVFHFSDRGGSDVVDSTSNSNNGVTDGNFTDDDDGLVGKANYINEGAAVIDIFEMDENTDFTVELLFKRIPANYLFRLYSTDNGGAAYVSATNGISLNNHIVGRTYVPPTVVDSESSVVYNGSWQYHQFVIDRTAGRQYLYTNLTADDDDDISALGSFNNSGKMAIGAGYIATIGRTSIGYLDEFRLSDCVRSSAWRKATYHAMMQTAGLITFDPVVYSATAVTNITTEISNTTATLNGYIANITGMTGNYDCGFWYGTDSSLVEGTYDANVTEGLFPRDTEFVYNATGLTNATDYYVRAWISNATFWATGSITNFTTNGGLPIFSNVVPSNQSTVDVDIDISIDIADPDGDLFDWTIETDSDIGSNNANGSSNGTKTCTITPTHNIDYAWYVNCTDGYGWTNASYNFTVTITYVVVPTNGISTYHTGVHYLNLTWDNNSGVSETYRTDNYIVVQRNDTYATSATQSGNWIRQNGSAAFLNISWSEISVGYFTIFGYNATANIYSYNNATPLGLDITWGAIEINVFDENNPWIPVIDYTVFITNEAGTETYYAIEQNNPVIISSDFIPFGVNNIVQISHDDFETRNTYVDMFLNAYDNFTFYLTPKEIPVPPDDPDDPDSSDDCILRSFVDSISITDHTVDLVINFTNTLEDFIQVEIYNSSLFGTYGGWIVVANDFVDYNTTRAIINKSILDVNSSMARVSYYYESCDPTFLPSGLYYIRIVESYVTSFGVTDLSVEDAKVTFQKYMNTTDRYENISTLFTDTNGFVNLYLIPGSLYRVVIEKSGYETKTVSYQPTSPNEFGQTTEQVFRIEEIDVDTEPELTIPNETVVVVPYNTTTFEIYYINLNNNNLFVNFSIYDGSTIIFTYNESVDPDEIVLYFNFSSHSLDNDILTLVVNATKNGSFNIHIRYFSISQAERMGPPTLAPIAAVLSICLCMFGLTLAHPKTVFGPFGIVVLIMAIAVTAFVPQVWYLHLLQAVELILLIFVILIFKEEGVHAV